MVVPATHQVESAETRRPAEIHVDASPPWWPGPVPGDVWPRKLQGALASARGDAASELVATRRRSIAAARASSSSSAASRPSTPSVTRSGIPPTFVLTTGRPDDERFHDGDWLIVRAGRIDQYVTPHT